MKNTTIRGIPDEVSAVIQQQAEIDRRSVNNEMVYLLELGAAVNDRRRASIQRGLAQSAAGQVHDLGDFSHYAGAEAAHYRATACARVTAEELDALRKLAPTTRRQGNSEDQP